MNFTDPFGRKLVPYTGVQPATAFCFCPDIVGAILKSVRWDFDYAPIDNPTCSPQQSPSRGVRVVGCGCTCVYKTGAGIDEAKGVCFLGGGAPI